jgi:5-methylcytosine-specific restriction endonuclease McrA
MKNPDNAKERNLIKGSIRRVFSRSELRRQIVQLTVVNHLDPTRLRVKKWSNCPMCKEFVPTYLMEVDHVNPIIGLNETLEDLSWDTVVDRIFCNKNNLLAICKVCHAKKSSVENAERRKLKKERK